MAMQSLIDGNEPPEPSDDSGTPPVEPPVTPPADEPPAFTPPADQAALDALIADGVTAAQAKAREGVPEKPEDYVLPEMEGVDKEELEGNNVYKQLRAAAADMGVPQERFDGFVKAWYEAEQTEIKELRDEQLALLGKDEATVNTRLTTLSGAVQRMLPAPEAKALMDMATTADAVKAIERLVNKTPTSTRDAVTMQPKDDAATISKLMASDAYMGREDQRDPEVIARVDKFFADGGTLKQ